VPETQPSKNQEHPIFSNLDTADIIKLQACCDIYSKMFGDYTNSDLKRFLLKQIRFSLSGANYYQVNLIDYLAENSDFLNRDTSLQLKNFLLEISTMQLGYKILVAYFKTL
jgi:hypothetical protein